jgi:hypothetical protein
MKFDKLIRSILENIDTEHQVGGEHWGEMKDDDGESHYVYVKDIIDAANKTVKTENVNTSEFENPGIAKPENVKKYAEDMKSNRWDWNKSGPIYGTIWQGKYGMFDGNHRLAAAQLAGLKQVPFKNVGDIIDTAIADKKTRKSTVIGGINIRTK